MAAQKYVPRLISVKLYEILFHYEILQLIKSCLWFNVNNILFLLHKNLGSQLYEMMCPTSPLLWGSVTKRKSPFVLVANERQTKNFLHVCIFLFTVGLV